VSSCSLRRVLRRCCQACGQEESSTVRGRKRGEIEKGAQASETKNGNGPTTPTHSRWGP
jgi:hypothetical protein